MTSATNFRYCIIGAGPSGLATCRQFARHGIPFDCLEREGDLGGVWNFGQASGSVYENTHFISSKTLSAFPDLPMPESYPPFPSHRQALAYLNQYADEFDLRKSIEFSTEVRSVRPTDDGWQVEVAGESAARAYAGVVIANGHHGKPLQPEHEGSFNGKILHAKQFKQVKQLVGKRVLVVGAGNSGCDIAAEAAQHADAAFLSMRRGYYFLPKFAYGRPIDEAGERMLRWGVPLWLRRLIASYGLRIAVGKPQNYGLPKPDHKLFETHPIINSQLLYQAGHGKIGVRPEIRRLDGDVVEFVDGRREEIDLLIYATGYEISFPFLDSNVLSIHDGVPDLYMHVMHRERDDFFVVGLVQPDGGLWPLSFYQAELAARFIVNRRDRPASVDWLQRKKANERPKLNGGIAHLASPRHRLEVEHFSFQRQLKRLIARFPGVAENQERAKR